MTDFDDSEDRADLIADALHARRYFKARIAHPDSQDPDFPGDDDEQGDDE